ncbi:Crp/Fnr family transcriptional regulator [Pseudooceanicola sp. MF1-13]|uniref:Crp/Fnr family transcriptional regulator n=1 Tax=Pseudooceanicola sp. MF1-13 TaxID=3379095 RepID=UPI0038928649
MRTTTHILDTGPVSGAARSNSCFASRLARYGTLSVEEQEFVARMEESERRVKKGEVILPANQPLDELFVVKEGWAVERSRARNGRQQSLRIILPGEVVGLSNLGVRLAGNDVVMATEGVVCPFPKDHMTAVYHKAPRLSALFTAITGLDSVTMGDRLALMGSGTARERMAHFLVDLHERLLVVNPDIGRRFRLPLRQVDIGEVLGLTKVYVNRMLKAFTDEHLIEIQRPYVRLLQPDVLKEIAGYTNRHDLIDHSWFPNAGQNGISLGARERPTG